MGNLWFGIEYPHTYWQTKNVGRYGGKIDGYRFERGIYELNILHKIPRLLRILNELSR